MATTTNYSWTTPDDTALVKDGAAAIRSLGTAIDTTVFNNAGAAIAKSIVDAKGDLIVATAADTVARLAVGGTNGHVLQVDSSTASGLKWDTVAAGGMTLISTTTLSGSSVTLSSIPSTYKHLQLIISGVTANTDNGVLRILPNNVNNLSDCGGARGYSSASDTLGYVNNPLLPHNSQATLRTSADNVAQITIFNYASASYFKSFLSTYRIVGTDSNTYSGVTGGAFSSTTAISSLVIDYGGTRTFSAGQVLFYGVS